MSVEELKLLDLTGCYNLPSIPPELFAMTLLKIKIGDLLTSASEVVIIRVPRTGIPSDIFSVLSEENSTKITQVIIHQEFQDDLPFNTVPI